MATKNLVDDVIPTQRECSPTALVSPEVITEGTVPPGLEQVREEFFSSGGPVLHDQLSLLQKRMQSGGPGERIG